MSELCANCKTATTCLEKGCGQGRRTAPIAAQLDQPAQRADFEAWAKNHLGQGYPLTMDEGSYEHPVTRWAFKAWQAARRAAPVAAQVEQIRAPYAERIRLLEREAAGREGVKRAETRMDAGSQPVVESKRIAPNTDADVKLDPLYDKAVLVVRSSNRASISLVQRHLTIGYNRAARLIEQMERDGLIVGPYGHWEIAAPSPQENTK